MQVPFYLIDVFADQPLTGNPLAVVSDADELDDKTMQNVARELHQAETTFVLAPTRATANWRLRSFTAAGIEVFGAGHNSLGAWWWLAESGRLPLKNGKTTFTQQIGDRLLPVEIEYQGQQLQAVRLTQEPPIYGKIHEDVASLADALGLNKADFAQALLPVQAVSTGVSHLLVPVENRRAVEQARPAAQHLQPILADAGAQGCYVYTLDVISASATAQARFFNPSVGLLEDSATGSAAGPLACQMIARGIAKQDMIITIEQGYEMGRPSLLGVYVGGDSVQLCGRCINVAAGTLRLR